MEDKQVNRQSNVFRRNNVESPVKKSLIGQIHSVVVCFVSRINSRVL